jgi:hypothetical protein
MFSNDVDYIVEEYTRFEGPEKTTLITRQCALEVATGRTAAQYLVGHFMAKPPKGSI